MPDMTCLYSVFGIFFKSVAARFEYRIHLHIAAHTLLINFPIATYGTAILPSTSPNTYR